MTAKPPIGAILASAMLSLFLVSGSGYGQSLKDTAYSNTVKINLAAGYFRNVSLFYERWFNDRWSAQLGAGYKITGKIPKFAALGDFVVTSNTGGIRGFSVAPEVRYHFNLCDCGRHTGLYAGAYSKLTWLYGDVTFNHWNGSEYVDVGAAGDLREIGFGLQLGYQFTLWERLVVDLFFMGPRTSFQKLHMELDSDFATEVIPRIEEELNKRLEALGLDPVEIPVSPEFTIDFRFNNFRYGIGIGYIF
jgi:hypothetical protein